MPRVSIVIPTRNRAHLLRAALQSALRQTLQDLEILVSDNYCGNEETRNVYESFQDPRLRYVRTEGLLAMHDSWEFALSHAKGEYVTFLPDDAYLLPFALERAMTSVEQYKVDLVAWNNSAYFSLDWLQPFQRNLLYVGKPPYSTLLLSSQKVLHELFDLHFSPHVPKFLNSMCHQRLVARILQVQGRMFFPPCPDYGAGASLLLNTDKYVFVGWPLGIDGGTSRSIGYAATLKDSQAFQEYMAEFKETASFRQSIDLDLATTPVLIAQSLENVRRSFYSKRFPYQVNRRNLLCQSIKSVANFERYGANVAEEWRILDEFMARQPEEVRRAGVAQRRRSKIRALLLTPVFRMLESLLGWEFLERLRGQYIFRGDQHCFQNIEQCAEVVPRLIAKLAAANAHETSKVVGEGCHGLVAHPRK